LTTGYLLQTGTQVLVFVKFRCSRCKKLGQEVVNRERWDWSVLEEDPTELNQVEKKRLEDLGPINLNEVMDFHFELKNVERLELEE